MKKIRIIGSGVEGIRQLTQEAIESIRDCRKVFILGSIEGLKELLNINKIDFEDVTSLYKNNQLDVDNYNAIKEKIIFDMDIMKDVALIVQGHPRLGVSMVQDFQAGTSSGGYQLVVIPGISSFDTMINDLMLDPIESGTSILDVNRLILFNYNMEPSINYFLYHVCSIGNKLTNYQSPMDGNHVEFLKEKLLKHYDKKHPISLVSSSIFPGEKGKKIEGTIESLDALLKNVKFDSSLFVPACIPKRKDINIKFYNCLVS